jgi:2-polyprenyl-3-methyl-5-hydroxy-6-metoxy-1,4-benzoquinol methylase
MSQASRADVINCYRTILQREPETDAILDEHLSTNPTVWDLVTRFLSSGEYMRRANDKATAQLRHEISSVEVDSSATNEEISRILADFSTKWTEFGQTEPYWSVLTGERYRMKDIDANIIEHFYESGIGEVDFFEQCCGRNMVSVNPDWEILDFGCGVGRVGEHFARRYRSYHGIDVSISHMNLARERLNRMNLHNWVISSLMEFITQPVDFDVLYSFLVLQHNPPPLIAWLLDRLLPRIRLGGVAFFQLPCHLFGYSFDKRAYLENLGRQHEFELHVLPQHRVFRILASHGFVPIEVVPYPCIGPVGYSFSFLAERVRKPG